MSEYKPTEYVVDFGDGRSNSFVRLNMALLRENGSKLVERVVRCRDCKWFDSRPNYQLCRRDMSCDEIAVCAEPNGFCAWACRKEVGDD